MNKKTGQKNKNANKANKQKRTATRQATTASTPAAIATLRANIGDGEEWTVLAIVGGDGVGLTRGTKIRVTGNDERFQLSPLSLHEWHADPSLRRVAPHSHQQEPAPWDPVWHWQGTVDVRTEDGLVESHTIKVGVFSKDPALLALYVNQNGLAQILR